MARLTGIRLVLVAVCLSICSCVRAPLKDTRQALRKASAPTLADDLPLDSLLSAIEAEVAYLEKTPQHQTFTFGEKVYTKAEYLEGLKHFVSLARTLAKRDEFYQAVKNDFDFFEVYGDKRWGEVFITSYYEPIVMGSRAKTSKFSRPLYRQPSDIVALDLAPFDLKYAFDRKLRGRLVDKKLVPYYTREEIDAKGALKGKNLELVWVDPLDAFMIQIQGSATINLGEGAPMRLAYADKNGQPYEPLGKFVKEFIPKDQLSLLSIESYMHSLPQDRQQEYLNKNPSYVFFQPTEKPALTSLGVAATGGRTVAVDQRFFPKGALCFLSTTKPKFDSPASTLANGSESLERFVLDQDIGGAITGGGRLDLFWGSGDEAKRYAGFMKQTGQLYYLAPKAQKK